jgi:hypothetical protein
MGGKKTKTLASMNKCGKIIGEPLCSELFKLNYNLDDFRAILFYRSKDYRFHEIFKDFPRDKENKKHFEKKYFDDFARGLLVYVENVIRKKEESDKSFSIGNLKGYVSKIVEIFFKELRGGIQDYKEITVNNEIITELRLLLSLPDLTIHDLFPLAKKPLSVEEESLLIDIKNLPGYRNCWFKVNKEEKLIMHIYQEDILEKIDFVISHSEKEKSTKNLIPLEERFENFYRILSKIERCVYRYRIKESYSLNEVVKICWNKPVNITNVNHVINDIIKKVKNTFLGSGHGKRN